MTGLVNGLRTRAAALPRWAQWLLVAVFMMVLAGVVTARYVHAHPALSPIDEYNYVDAVDKATRGILAREGQTVDELAREASSCRGFGMEQTEVTYVGRCGIDEPLATYPWDGHSTAGIHSPVYYFSTAWMAQAIMTVVPGLSLITAARLTGAIWLGLGMVMLAYVIRRTAGSWWLAVWIPVVVCAMPGLRVTNAYISPDAPNLLCGSAVLLAALLYARGQWPLWPLIAISAVVTLVKFQNSFVVIAAFLFLAWTRIAPRREDDDGRRPGWAAILVPPAAALVVGLGWMRMKTALALPSAGLVGDPQGGVDLTGSLYYIDDSLQGLFTANWPASTEASFFPTLVLWGGIATLVSVAWLHPGRGWVERRFAQSGAVSLLGIGPAVNIAFAAVFGSAVAMQPRYAMVLIPILALTTAWSLDRRCLRIAVAVLAVAAYFYAVVSLNVN